MCRTKGSRLGSLAIVALVLAIVIIMPTVASATLLDPFGDSSVTIGVSVTGNGDIYTYDYLISNPGNPLMVISVGSGDTTTGQIHSILGSSAGLPADKIKQTSSSFMVYFLSGLPKESVYEFSVTYAGFLVDQNISVTTFGDMVSKTVVSTNCPPPPVPEPGTVLLLGTAVLAVGLFYRGRRKAI